jgi:hypothetical protein
LTMLSEVQITPHLIGRFLPILGEDAVRAAEAVAAGVGARLAASFGTSARPRVVVGWPRCCLRCSVTPVGAALDRAGW